MTDANSLLAWPGPDPAVQARLARDLARLLCQRAGIPDSGASAALLADLLAAAWLAGRSPRLDELLKEGLAGDRVPAGAPGDELARRLELALRFVVAAPEFGSGPPEPVFALCAAAARAAATAG